MVNEEMVAVGRKAVASGKLQRLREKLALSRNAMADMLYTAPATYASWESGSVTLRPHTAERVGRFMVSAEAQLKDLREHKIRIANLIPFHIVARELGVPNELLFKRYREGLFPAEDLGILGLWVYILDMPKVEEAVLG